MRGLLWFSVPIILCANEDFISPYEYGNMLYNNPRGVSCAKCHGENGEGKLIASYETKEGKVEIIGADIREKSLEEMIKSVNSYHPVMPTYSLTHQEVVAIYGYLQEKKRQKNDTK